MHTKKAFAAVFTQAGKPLTLKEFPVTKPKGEFVLLSLKLSGICGTDNHIMEGRLAVPPPFIPGHEFIGTIELAGPRVQKDGLGHAIKKGDLAIACVAQPCGRCFNCKNHGDANCLNFKVTNFRNPEEPPHLFGGFAEKLYHPGKNLVLIPRGLPLEAVAAFPCAGPTAIHGFKRSGGLKRGETVLVQGTGPVGLFAIVWAKAAGCKVAAIGSTSNPIRSALAQSLGAEKVWDYRLGSAADRCNEVKAWVKSCKGGDGADVVFEASGSPLAMNEGLNMVRTLGRYIIPGQYSSSGTVAIHPETITFKALTLVGSSQYSIDDIGTYLSFLKKHPELHKPFSSCITHRYKVTDAVTACADSEAGKAIKAVFEGEH